MVTHDAYSWLRWARFYQDRTWPQAYSGSRDVTVISHYARYPVNMLTWLAATMAHVLNTDVYNAAVLMVTFCSGLFILPLGFYCRRLGVPYAGLLGGAIGTVTYEYMIRSCAGCFDNDILILFFLFLISYLILASCEAPTNERTVLYAALSGVTTWLFYWLYQHELFNTLFLGTLIISLLAYRKNGRVIVLSASFYAIYSQPYYLLHGISNFLNRFVYYWNPTDAVFNVASGIFLPNGLKDIAEARPQGISGSLALLIKDPWLSGIGLALFVLVGIFYGRRMLPLLPIFAIGLLSFKSGRRFLMYLSPFVGLGYGLLFALMVSAGLALCNRWRPGARWLYWLKDPVVILVSLGFFFAVLPKTTASFRLVPTFSTKFYAAMRELKKIAPTDSWAWNYWDYGYIVADTADMNVYADGSAPGSPWSYFMARSYTTSSPGEMYRLIRYADNSVRHLAPEAELMRTGGTDYTLKLWAMADETPLTNDRLYVIFDEHMMKYFSAIYSLGAWDFKTGKDPFPGYRKLKCDRSVDKFLICEGHKMDLDNGTIDGEKKIKRAFMIRDGKAYKHSEYGNPGWNMEFVMNEKGEIIYVLLLNDTAYNSNFNQMYLLGNYDKNLYEETLNAFPYARVFRVKPGMNPKP